MRIALTLLAACTAVPVPLLAQATPQELLGGMTANVARIGEPGERERWLANTGLWQIALAQPQPAKAELARMSVLLERVRANIAKVTAPAERERWQANVELWTVATRARLDFRAGDDIKLRGPFERMKLNVVAITEPGEQARWTANRDLWQVMVNRASATRVDPVIAPHNP